MAMGPWRRALLLVLHPFRGRGVDHQQEALLGRGELRDVVLRVRPPDMLLHRTIAFFLEEILVSADRFISASGRTARNGPELRLVLASLKLDPRCPDGPHDGGASRAAAEQPAQLAMEHLRSSVAGSADRRRE